MGIYTSEISVTDIKRIGTRKNEFTISYYLNTEGMENKEFQILLVFEA